MFNRRTLWTVSCMSLALGASAFAQDNSYKLETPDLNQAQLIIPARRHPEVEVSRSLHDQPVWPWMAKVVLGGDQGFAPNAYSAASSERSINFGGGTIQHTWIDPLQKLEGLDQNHSLVRAQRLHLQLTGVTTSDLAAMRNAAIAAKPSGAPANHALLIIPPQHMSNHTGQVQVHNINFGNPRRAFDGGRLIMPKVQPDDDAPRKPFIPSVPRHKSSQGKTLAAAE